jgi:thiol-disulfide isomerase/thioredoxin
MMRVLRLVTIAAICIPAACDWFEDPVETNIPPDTSILECATASEVSEGEDVRFGWTGGDIDGTVSGYEYSYDGSEWVRTDLDSVTVADAALGEHLFRVRAVDDDGDVDPTPAECSFKVRAAGHLVDRVVHLELFTATWCTYCPKAEEALNSLLDEYGADNLSIIAFHVNDPERPDPFGTAETHARVIWHQWDPDFPYDSNALPTVAFDGIRYVQEAETAELAKAYYRSEIELRAAVGSPLSIRTAGEIGPSAGTVTAVIKVEDRLPEGNRFIRFAVIEDDVYYVGPYSLWYDFVARDLPADERLDLVAIGDSVTVQRQFSVDGSWIPDNMDVIVFVQDLATKEVIQSARLRHD